MRIDDPEIKRYRFTDAARKRIGRFYHWGGQSVEDGFDCSGFVVDCLKEAGVVIPDTTAAGLFKLFSDKQVSQVSKQGQLIFYAKGGHVNHVMVALDIWAPGKGTICGARGGGSSTKTIHDAWAQKAFVDVTAADYWKENFFAVVDPWMAA